MKKRIICFATLLSVFSSFAYGAGEVDVANVKIDKVLIRSADYMESKYYNLLTMSFQSELSVAGCNNSKLYIYTDQDRSLYSAILSAKAQNAEINIIVSSNATKVDGICKLGAIEL